MTESVELTSLTILLERMKTHPEEFANGGDVTWRGTRWDNVIKNATTFMTEEELFKLEKGLKECARTMFNGRVLEILAGQDVEQNAQSAFGALYEQNLLLARTRETNEILRGVIDNAPVEIKRGRSRTI